ncbi:T9SS type A sorting domain-containing protein [Polaribacter sp. Asnod6-C07]|uniref:T9SS type A sorting domain-containing protein n=1 Tax=Polaribacter sp. Asnod6-C07 TaxID=3160582 RepID=UPI0038672FBC
MKKTLLFTFAFLLVTFVASAQSNTLTYTSGGDENQELGLGSNQEIYALSADPSFTQGGAFIQYNKEIVSGVDAPVSETFSINTDGSNINATLTFKYRKFAASTVSGVISIAGQADFPFDLPDTTVEDGDPDHSGTHKFFDYTVEFPISSTATNVTFTLNEFVKNAASTLRFRIYSIKINGTVPTPPLDSEATLDAGNEWYFNYSPDTFGATVNEVQGGVFLAQGDAVATPSTTENSSTLVAKFTKEDEASSQVKFQLPALITTANQSKAIFKIRAYIPSTNNAPGTTARRLRLFLRDGDLSNNTQKNVTIDVTTFDKWQEYTFDFTGVNLTADSYSTVNLLFDQPDPNFDATGNVYYLDAFQGPSADTLPVDNFELNSASITAYPNPVTNSFQIDSSEKVDNVKLYNISGRLVKTFKANTNYDVSDLATGVYITTIKTQLGSKTLRLVKK